MNLMIKSYFTAALRNLLKHKTFSIINILGLSVGIAACLVIFIYIHHELTFDQYNRKAERIVRITTTVHAPGSDIAMATTPALLAATIQKDYPEVEAAVRLEKSDQAVRMDNEFFREENFHYTDQTVFDIFTFDIVQGTEVNALGKPNTIVITESIAKKYYGNRSPIGKTLQCNRNDRVVTAVIKDRPANSDIKIDALMSHDYKGVTEWIDGFSVYTFVLFNAATDVKNFERKLINLSNKYVQPELDKGGGAGKYSAQFLVERLSDVHYSEGKHDDTPKGNRRYNYVFSLLSVIILLIALLNYINLSTAKAADRAKEVGVRKVSGASRNQLVRQFLFESFLLVSIAWAISIVFVYFTIPALNRLLQTILAIQWTYLIIFTGLVFILSSLLAGIYPAFVLSSFRPMQVLMGKMKHTGGGIRLRKIITVTQFGIAAALIMGATVIYRQMHYIENKDLGFENDKLVNIYLSRDSTDRGAVNAFVTALNKQPRIKNVTVGGGAEEAGLTIGSTYAEDKGGKRELMSNYFAIDPQFLSVFKIQLLQGRNLSEKMISDKKGAVLVNEAFIKVMGWESPIGKKIDGWNTKGEVVGVVKNFYYKSLHNLVEPLVMTWNDAPINIATLNLSPKDMPMVKAIYQRYFPSVPFNYRYFDDILSKQYEKDRVTMALFNNFTMLAILISCLGLYGLVTLITGHRIKEIGIRKILGASMTNLVLVLSKDYIKLLTIALLIALPLAGIVMDRWLKSYAYHESIVWWIFLVPAVIVLFVAIIVIGGEVVKAAIANPIHALRHE